MDGCDAAVSSRLAYPEVCAALAAAGRAHRLSHSEQRIGEQLWEELWSATRPINVSEAVTIRAGQIAGTHALSGAAACHLASLLAVGADEVMFAAWDERLRAGARSMGAWLAPLH